MSRMLFLKYEVRLCGVRAAVSAVRVRSVSVSLSPRRVTSSSLLNDTSAVIAVLGDYYPTSVCVCALQQCADVWRALRVVSR